MGRVGRNGRWRLALNALAPAHARRLAASVCEQLPAEALDEVLLLTTELVSNAMWHGAGDAVLDVRVAGDVVTVGVTDGGDGQVSFAAPYRWPESGHGLRLVDALSDRWGVDRPTTDAPGKRVWFERRWRVPGT